MNLDLYSKIIIAFSGGKDSLACLLHLLDMGVKKSHIELWHHDVDGQRRTFMDWECTPAYVRAIARAFEIPVYFSWKEGGFEREMNRENQPTAPTWFEQPLGLGTAGGKGKPNTRLKFPQVSADLSVRWCSAYLKISIADIALRHQERFNNNRTLFITGERAAESAARSQYKTFEPHRADLRNGKSRRHIDHWRPVHSWSETQVWDIIKKYKVNPHPAYKLGWGRVSCCTCIFGSPDQWASVRALSPERFEKIAQYERSFDTTISRTQDVVALADKGVAYAATKNATLVQEAFDSNWDYPVFVDDWQLPSGAFGELAGPS